MVKAIGKAKKTGAGKARKTSAVVTSALATATAAVTGAVTPKAKVKAKPKATKSAAPSRATSTMKPMKAHQAMGKGGGAAAPAKPTAAKATAATTAATAAQALGRGGGAEPQGGGAKLVDPVPNWRNHITSHVGHRESPGGIGSTDHKGLDIGVASGTPIQAVKDGVVVSAGPAGGYGNLVVIKHDDGTFTKYAHQSAILVSAGQTVKAGDVIGRVGSTGNSTGPHLHFEVRRGNPDSGEVLDPEAYLNGAVSVAAVGGDAPAINAVSGGHSPSRLSLGGRSGGGSSGGGSSGGSSGGAPSGGVSSIPSGQGDSAAPAAESTGTPVVSSSGAVGKGNFSELLKKLEGFGIDRKYLEELAKKYGVPIEVILAIMMQESGGDPNAKSGAGALGLMQLMPGTAAGLGVTNPLDPKQNLEGGVKYLAEMHKNPRAGGDWGRAFAMYNAGPAGNFDNAETQNYIKSVPQLVEQAKAALG